MINNVSVIFYSLINVIERGNMSHVTFLDKGVELVGNKNSMEPYTYQMFSFVSTQRKTASTTPGYGTQPLHCHQTQTKTQNMKNWPKRAKKCLKCAKSITVCTRHESQCLPYASVPILASNMLLSARRPSRSDEPYHVNNFKSS